MGQALSPHGVLSSFEVGGLPIQTGIRYQAIVRRIRQTQERIFDSILNRSPISPLRVNRALPAELDRIIEKCLEKDRDLRYQHASAIRADLERLKRDTEPAGLITGARHGAGTGVSKRWRTALFATAAVAGLAAEEVRKALFNDAGEGARATRSERIQ